MPLVGPLSAQDPDSSSQIVQIQTLTEDREAEEEDVEWEEVDMEGLVADLERAGAKSGTGGMASAAMTGMQEHNNGALMQAIR